MTRVDLHSHTHVSPDCRMRPDDILKATAKAGIGVLAVTDHDRIEGAFELQRAARDADHLDVIVGEEVMTPDGEVVGLYLNELVEPGPLGDVVDAIRDQGGLVMLQHPYDLLRHGLGDRGREVRPDIVEVFNARSRRPSDNRRAAALRDELGVPGVANSDAHTLAEYGTSYTETQPFDASEPGELLEALAAGRPVGRTSPVWVHVGSTWAKLAHSVLGR